MYEWRKWLLGMSVFVALWFLKRSLVRLYFESSFTVVSAHIFTSSLCLLAFPQRSPCFSRQFYSLRISSLRPSLNGDLLFLCVLKYLSSPNSNFPGPFLRKLPLIHVGIVPLTAVGMASGVSSAEVTRAAKLSSPLACGQRCQLGTERKLA